MSNRKIIAREFALYSLSFLFMQLVTVALAVFIRNVLGPEQMGVWVALQVVLTYTKYSNLGLAPAAGREIPFERGRGHLDRVRIIRDGSYLFTVVMSSLLSFAMAVAAFVLRERFGELFFWSLLALAFLSFFQRVSTFCIAILRAEKRFTFINRFNVYSSLANAALTVVLILRFGLYGYYASMGLSFAFNLFFILTFSGIPFRFAWDWKEMKPLFGMGLGLIAVSLGTTFFNSVDKMAIAASSGAAALGVYSITLMVGGILASFPNNLGVIIFPYLNEAYGASKDPAEIRKYLVTPNLFVATYLSVVIAFLWTAAPFLVTTFLPKYTAGTGALRLALFSTLFLILSGAMSDALIAFKRYAWTIPLQFGIGSAAFCASTLALRAGKSLTWVAGIGLAAVYLLWLSYALIALRRVGSAADTRRHVFQVTATAGYFMAAVLSADALRPGERLTDVAVRVLILTAASVPVVWAGEKRFHAARLFIETIRHRVAPAAGVP